jgi:hypothetical protein
VEAVRRSQGPPSLFDSPATSQPGRRPLGFAPPPHDGYALLASATRMPLPAETFPMLAMNAPYNDSWPHSIPLEGLLRRGAKPLCCFASRSLLMPALLPRADESAMNIAGLGVSLSRFLMFSEAFLRIGSELRTERGLPVSGDLRNRIGAITWA